MVVKNDYERAIGEFIIGSINEDGFLEISDEEIAKNLDIPVEDVSSMVKIIQEFDPPGIAAHNLQESLLIQLKEREAEDSIAWKIISGFYNELTNRKFAEIMRALSISEEKLKEAIEIISALTPKPGASFNPSGNTSVVPDIIVEKIEGKYVVMLNDWSIPHLTINSGYRKLLNRGADTPPETKKYLVDKLNSAKWFINSIEQRRSTIMKVATAIVERQSDFLDKGLSYLKPLTLQDIAESIGIAVSTVQRVTSGKYIQTPKGVLELKYFFGQRISSSDGTEDVSSKSVKEKLKEIIEKEDPKKPLSDQIIAETLNKMGISISRRAIAKYRDELHIPSARLRKQF
jgi:RNA polymerase sigma-54 factor